MEMPEKTKKNKIGYKTISKQLPALMMASVVGLVGFLSRVALLGTAWMTIGVFAGIAFVGTALAQRKRDTLKKQAYKQHEHDYYIIEHSDEYKAAFNMGKEAAVSLKVLIESCFNKNAMKHSGGYYAGMVKRLKDEKQIALYRLLSQEDRNRLLYAILPANNESNQLNPNDYDKASYLLAAGADPNFIALGSKISLIEWAIKNENIPMFYLLRQYKAQIFREDYDGQEILSRSLSKSNDKEAFNHYFFWQNIADDVGTTQLEFLQQYTDFVKSDQVDKPPYVFCVLGEQFMQKKQDDESKERNQYGMKVY